MMVSVAQREKLDLLHVHYAIPHAYAAYMARKILEDQGIPMPVVTTLHGTDITLVGKHPSSNAAALLELCCPGDRIGMLDLLGKNYRGRLAVAALQPKFQRALGPRGLLALGVGNAWSGLPKLQSAGCQCGTQS